MRKYFLFMCFMLLLPFQAYAQADLSVDTVTSNGKTNTLSVINQWLTGVANPNPIWLQGQSAAAITTDQFQISASLNNPSVTADYLYSCIISASCSQTVVAADAIRGIATLTAGTTTPLTVTGIAGYYLDNQVENAGAAVAVALFGAGVCSVAGANCWGVDTLQSDHLGLNTSTTTGVGLYNEFDFNITSPYTTGAVLAIGPGTWLVQPAGINGISVNTPWGSCGIGPCAPFAKYANGLVVQSGAATTGINIGAANYTVTANVASMPIYMTYYDSSATAQNISFTALGGSFYLGGTTSTVNLDIVKGSLFLPTGQGVQVNNNVLASASATSAFLAPGAGFTTVQVGNGTAQISLNGPVGYGITLPTGTPATYACFTAAGGLISNPGPC